MRGYTLPAGNVQISFSGGRTSAYMLHQILAVNGDLPERCKVVFSNTGREMPNQWVKLTGTTLHSAQAAYPRR